MFNEFSNYSIASKNAISYLGHDAVFYFNDFTQNFNIPKIIPENPKISSRKFENTDFFTHT